MKILCLHGYRQNADAFRDKTGSFRKFLRKQAELVYISAPNIASVVTEGIEEPRSWWFTKDDQQFSSRDETNICRGFEESVNCIKNGLLEQGPFDGILGFSQGATMAALFCDLIFKQEIIHPSLKFAIFIAGFKSRCRQHDGALQSIDFPSLHIFGESDNVIPKEMSEELLARFTKTNTKVLIHPGGHYVPGPAVCRGVVDEFVKQFVSSVDKS